MSTYGSRTFTNVFDDARAIGLLNNAALDRYSDDVLLPHGAYAYVEIQEEFAASGIPLVETVSDTFDYTAEAETIPIPGGITDLAEPIELWEKGTSDSLWIPMIRVSGVGPPPTPSQTTLHWWEWLNGAFRVPKCSANRDVFVRYRRQLAYPVAGTLIGFDRIYLALVAGTAFFAATREPEIQQKAGIMYGVARDRAIRIASRDRQSITYQRRPWNQREQRRIVQQSS